MDQKLGRKMTQRNIRLSDIARGGSFTWSDKSTFRDSVHALGLTTTDAELDEFFESILDADGDGNLSVKELKRALGRLQTAAAVAVADDVDQTLIIQQMQNEISKAYTRANKAYEKTSDLLLDELKLKSEINKAVADGVKEEIYSASFDSLEIEKIFNTRNPKLGPALEGATKGKLRKI